MGKASTRKRGVSVQSHEDGVVVVAVISPAEGVGPSGLLLAVGDVGLTVNDGGVSLTVVFLGWALRLIISDLASGLEKDLSKDGVIVMTIIGPSERVGPARLLFAILNVRLSVND